MKTIFLFMAAVLVLSACDKAASEQHFSDPVAKQSGAKSSQTQDNDQTSHVNATDPHDLSALAKELGADSEDMPEVQPITTADGKIQIDWSHIHTKQPRADLATYTYPIALDSQAVKNYAQAYNITEKQAQHSMVVGMASPEVLGKVLDQLKDGKYLGHHLTDGADMTLIITTTPDVVADKTEYVFEGEFGQGLALPVVIEPKTD